MIEFLPHAPGNKRRVFEAAPAQASPTQTAPAQTGPVSGENPESHPEHALRVPVPGLVRSVWCGAGGRPAAPMRTVRIRTARPARVSGPAEACVVSRSAPTSLSTRAREHRGPRVLRPGVRGSSPRHDTRAQVSGQDLGRARPCSCGCSRCAVRLRDAA